MLDTGIIRKVDELGRIVIPKEIRDEFKISERDDMQIYVNGDTIVLKKRDANCIFCDSQKNLIEYGKQNVCLECLGKLSKLDEQYKFE